MNAKDIKIIFLGTPQIAATILSGLIKNGYNISSVVTQPDRPRGRSDEPVKSPVKTLAVEHHLSLFQPQTKSELEEYIVREKPDLAIITAFGMILTGKTVKVPKYGTLNVHPSLLPKYRGPWPVGASILSGDQKTGITIMQVNEKMDEGNIISQVEYPLNGSETTPELTQILANLSVRLLTNTIPKWLDGGIKAIKQDHTKASYTKLEKKDDGKIDWEKMSAPEIERMSRAYAPWPGIYTYFKGKKLDLFDIFVKDVKVKTGEVAEENGEILIGTKNGSISPAYVKIEGRSKIPLTDFVRGHQDFIGSKLGK